MELKLQQFIDSMEVLSNIRNLDVLNPVLFLIEQPVTAIQFTTIAAIQEPSHLGVPINATWVCMNSVSPYYRRALKLKAKTNVPGTLYDGVAAFSDLQQAWIEVTTFYSIFNDAQFYDNGSSGPPGPVGPRGLTGPAGATPVVDYQFIIDNVLANMPAIVPALEISGAILVPESGTAQYSVNLLLNGVATPVVSQIAVSTGALYASINASNMLTANAVTVDQTVVLSASFTYSGQLLTATKTITVSNSVLTGLTISGLPATMYVGHTAQLVAHAVYANGTTAVVQANYWIDRNVGSGSVSGTGLYTAISGPISSGVIASYIENGITVISNELVTSVVPVLPASIVITGGANSVVEGGQLLFGATVTNNDGTFVNAVSSAAWTIDNAALGSVAAGVFTSNLVAADSIATLTASYSVGGTTVFATKQVTVQNSVVAMTPYYGAGPATAVINAALVTALPNRGPATSRLMNPCVMTTGVGESMYYAYPTSYGQALFTDNSNGFQGGMDGATGDPTLGAMGPLTINVMMNGVSTPFYVYKSDWPNLGIVSWNVS